MEKKLSPSEEAIFNLIGLEKYVDGVLVERLGFQVAPEDALVIDDAEAPSFVSEVEISDIIEEENFVDMVIATQEPQDNGTAATSKITDCVKTGIITELCSPVPKQSKAVAAAALKEEIKIQNEICAHIKTAATDLKEQHGSLNKISQRLDKIYDIQKKHYKEMESHLKEVNLIKKEKIEEMKRHNYVMEKMRRKEIEYKLEKNRRLMEIEDLKVRKSNDGQMQCD
ncbi:uncharacterized protein LOC118740327 [Rhagoletis pomonella]|uniref:uncharacterized protein LOC118740327 n=1 Tax=Rhagoletis pomonella TaxID=28610 RepID=UPI0017860BF1|nr:uncharacterized protein LOC118740327 [Rhagoletis pomonella]